MTDLKLAWLEHLKEQHGDFKVHRMEKDVPKWATWKLLSECSPEELEQANLREVLQNEIILDCDHVKPDDVAAKLKEFGWSYSRWKTGSRGEHFHLFFPELEYYTPETRTAIKEKIIRFFGCDLLKKNGLIALEYAPHFKCTGKLKDVIDNVVLGVNKIPEEFLKKTSPTNWNEPSGVAEGERHKNRFILTKELYNLGKPESDIREAVLNFNQNCDPPENEGVVKRHLDAIFSKPEQYLRKGVEWESVKDSLFKDKDEQLEISDFNDMVKENTKTEYIVSDLLAQGHATLLGAPPGTCKSLFALFLGLKIASGQDIFGFLKTKKSRVLYLDAEMSRDQINKRMRFFNNVYHFDIERGFFRWACIKQNPLKSIQREIEKGDYDVVIFDSYRRFVTGDLNSSEFTDSFYKSVHKPLLSRGKTILIIHHFRKRSKEMNDDDLMEMFSGNQDIVATFDLALALVRGLVEVDREKQTKKIELTLARCKERDDSVMETCSTLSVLLDKVAERSEIRFIGEQKMVTTEERIWEIVYKLLSEEQKKVSDEQGSSAWVSFKTIQERVTHDLGKVGKTTLSQTLGKMVERKTIKKGKRGEYSLPDVGDF